MSLIGFSNVGLRYSTGPEILSDVSFTLEKGSFHFLTGASGAGKTSLLKMLYVGTRPTRGIINMFGQDITAMKREDLPAVRRQVGTVFQDFRLLMHLSAYDNVALPMRIAGVDEEHTRRNVTELLRWVGLGDKMDAKPPMRAEDKDKIDEDEQKAFDEKAQKIAAMGTSHPALASGRVLDRAEVLKLIEPWLGSAMPADLPLPALIDLKLLPDADIEQLKKDILAIAPKATVDTHDDTLKDVSTLVNTARLFVLLLSGVIMLLAIFAISGMVRAKLAIHHQEVETLHLIGANDEYIARQFRHHTLKGTLKGAVLGVLAMLLTLFAIGHMTRTIDSSLLPSLDVLPVQWIVLLFSPILAGALIAHMTAQKTVMNALARLD